MFTVSGFQSEKEFLQFGVPQASVLGLVLFTMYTQPLVHIMRKFNPGGPHAHFIVRDILRSGGAWM